MTVTNTGTIITFGDSSHAIMAQSVGGGGGLGGDSVTTSTPAGTNTQRSVNLTLSLGGSGSLGGNAGAVNVFQNGQIYTVGANSYGILAQSIGGGGGAGGTSVSTPRRHREFASASGRYRRQRRSGRLCRGGQCCFLRRHHHVWRRFLRDSRAKHRRRRRCRRRYGERGRFRQLARPLRRHRRQPVATAITAVPLP